MGLRRPGSEVMTIIQFRGEDVWIRVMAVEMEREKQTSGARKNPFIQKKNRRGDILIKEEVGSRSTAIQLPLCPYGFSTQL